MQKKQSIDVHPVPSIDVHPVPSIDVEMRNAQLGACPAVPEVTRTNTCYSQMILLTWNARSAKTNVPHRSTQQLSRRPILTPNRRPIPDLHRRPIYIDENGNLYDQDGRLRNATDDDFWQVVKHEKLGEGDFEVESSMSFGRSQWCRPMSTDTLRSTDHDEDRSTDYSRH
ncbi:hypothetical protein F2Q69_00028601 [Brassica cretica]|uniref:Uncharacterized protein n=1 Tax=Brassica cretica TaxID=69181 RepID=A0A8S9RX20_BRACR|nr:hypothetical protein F2Q69_00028601 [Brassica cretica]